MMQTVKPIYFKVNKPVGGGIMPSIPSGTHAVAYEDGQYFIVLPYDTPFTAGSSHFYQSPRGDKTLEGFAESEFAATDFIKLNHNAGECVPSIWRPGRQPNDDIALDLENDPRMRSDKQVLLLLVSKLSEIFLFIEPTNATIGTFGHRIRELHILACTEIENSWRQYLAEALSTKMPDRPTTRDYVRLSRVLHLAEHCVNVPQYPDIPTLQPFFGWHDTNPTKTLPWYDNYNLSKHNRRDCFHYSTLQAAISSTAASIIMFSIRYGHFNLFTGKDYLSAQISQLLRSGISQSDPSTWYVPKPTLNRSLSLDAVQYITNFQPWVRRPISI